MAKGIEHRSHSTIRFLNVDKDTKHDSLTANVSTLDSQSSEERTYFCDKQITYVKRKTNKQYTAGIMKLAGLTKKILCTSHLKPPNPPIRG